VSVSREPSRMGDDFAPSSRRPTTKSETAPKNAPTPSRRFLDEPDPELPQLLSRHFRRRSAHRIHARLILRESDDVTKIRLQGDHHHHAIDPERDPAMRRRPHRESVQEKAELRALLLG